MSLRFESVFGLNPKVIRHGSSIPNLAINPLSVFANPPFVLSLRPTPFLALAASNEEDGAEIAPENNDHRIGVEESWKQALDTFREQASKIREASEEAYGLYSEKAVLVLKEATEELRVAAMEIGDESKHYLTVVAENSPEVKQIVETFTSPNHDFTQISQLRDFYVGVPYGLVLSVGGFVSFMVTGSIAALRFGIVLGGVLLVLSVSSLKSYKRGKASSIMLKGQTAIASILFLREIRLLAAEGSPLVTYFTSLISGAVVAFYIYRLVLQYKQQNASNLEVPFPYAINGVLREKPVLGRLQSLHLALPTVQFRHSRYLANNATCARCSCSSETLLHALRDCLYLWELWIRLDARYS
ncbi:hypothetical protein VNO78_26093 [Psophocarpus tetragonolobus]|uniref:Uncharacterized protein n=1 Tax=Psophocarpus tetragonolobus TaxID=3891 RepID=A0AAN9RZV6_PSOTE